MSPQLLWRSQDIDDFKTVRQSQRTAAAGGVEPAQAYEMSYVCGDSPSQRDVTWPKPFSTTISCDLFRYSSEENSSPASSSLTSISSAWLSFRSIDASGIRLPVSHFEMVLSVTSICSANCFCDNPCFFLLYAIKLSYFDLVHDLRLLIRYLSDCMTDLPVHRPDPVHYAAQHRVNRQCLTHS